MITTELLSYQYDKDDASTLVLKEIDLTIRKGEFVAVLGHNGSGKSTFAKHLNAILLPSGGKVYIDGIGTADEARIYDIRQRVGMVFQNPDNQIVATVVEEDVAFALENLGVPREEILVRVEEALRAVGMLEHRRKAPHLLSGGQKQRVAIAGIIAMQPDYIVLDEPTAMLDPSGRKEVMKTIKRLNRDLGITIITITHYMDEALAADRLIVMDDGKVLMDGAPVDIFADVAQMKKIGLDVPQATELIYELKKLGADVSCHVPDVENCIQQILALGGKA